MIKTRCYYQSEEDSDYPANFQRNKVRRSKKSSSRREPETDTTNPTTETIKDNSEFFQTANRIETSLNDVNTYFKKLERKAEIKHKWSFVARVIERIFMIIFLSFTLLFAIIMLNARGDAIVLNEKLMSSILTS